MIKAILQFLLIFFVLVLLLSLESAVGLPVIFLAVLSWLSVLFANLLWWPLILILILSFVMAAVYQIPMAAAFIILILAGRFNIKAKGGILTKRMQRILLTSAAGSLVVLLISDLDLASLSPLTLILQSGIVLLLVWRMLGLPISSDKSLTKRLGRN